MWLTERCSPAAARPSRWCVSRARFTPRFSSRDQTRGFRHDLIRHRFFRPPRLAFDGRGDVAASVSASAVHPVHSSSHHLGGFPGAAEESAAASGRTKAKTKDRNRDFTSGRSLRER